MVHPYAKVVPLLCPLTSLVYAAGQHRWVEYADIHNYDSSSVTADWHPWLHHMSDHTPAKTEVRVCRIGDEGGGERAHR